MIDETTHDGRWVFDQRVTDVFDDMLARSIPGFEDMRELTTELACYFASKHPNGSTIIDMGCSRGGSLLPIIDKRGAMNKYIGIEVSDPMRLAAEEELAAWISNGFASVVDLDLRRDFPKRPTAVVLSVFTIQFTPIEYRQQIIRRAFETLLPGGAMIVVEKILGSTHSTDHLLRDLYYGMKSEHGYTPEQINTKREALEGVLVPVTEKMNVELLQQAGFVDVEAYWRSLNFAGWLAVRPT